QAVYAWLTLGKLLNSPGTGEGRGCPSSPRCACQCSGQRLQTKDRQSTEDWTDECPVDCDLRGLSVEGREMASELKTQTSMAFRREESVFATDGHLAPSLRNSTSSNNKTNKQQQNSLFPPPPCYDGSSM
ncbi:hypothetical protein LEMLEM_LOCUS25089, partial [Lemmus lemmus]